MKYSPLGIKSEYTLLTSLIKISDLINFAKQNNITALGLLDNNLNGVMEFFDSCVANDIKPIIGLSVRINDSNYYLYAKNYQGYLELVKINNKIVLEESVSLSDLGSSDIYVVIPYEFKGNYEELKNIKNINDIYIAYTNLEEKKNLSLVISNILFIKEIRCFNSGDTVYLEYLKKIGNNDFETLNTAYETDKLNNDDIERLNKFISTIDIKMDKSKRYIPVFNKDVNSKTYLYNLAFLGLKKRLNNNSSEQYLDRLNYELEIIIKISYLLLFQLVHLLQVMLNLV